MTMHKLVRRGAKTTSSCLFEVLIFSQHHATRLSPYAEVLSFHDSSSQQKSEPLKVQTSVSFALSPCKVYGKCMIMILRKPGQYYY